MSSKRKAHPRRRGISVILGMGIALGLALASPYEASAAVVADDLDPVDGQVMWRWVGILLDEQADCEVDAEHSTTWTARKLFSVDGRTRWPALEKFCVYEFIGPDPIPEGELLYIDGLDGCYDHVTPAAGAPKPHGGVLRSVSPDRAAVTTAGTVTDGLWPRLADLFDDQAGRALLPTPLLAPRVRLTIVDTSPTVLGPLAENSDHGRTLRLMAERLLCTDNPCLVDVRTRLALAFEGVSLSSRNNSYRNSQQGGFLGLISELAEAIVEEIDDWEASRVEVGERLILNLSVAWDTAYGGLALRDSLREDARAVYEALEGAACDGRILTVAAAGNVSDRHGANGGFGPLLPAAWRERKADCGTSKPPPLLVAAAAVDGRRWPLVNAIPGGIPEFAAYGDHAVVEDTQQLGEPSAVLTGSSVASLVTSAAVAAVAAYRQDLSLKEVVKKVYFSGAVLNSSPAPADFCALPPNEICALPLSGQCVLPQTWPCLATRVVSVCQAVSDSCSPSQSYCPPSPLACAPTSSQVPSLLTPVPILPQTLSTGLFASSSIGCQTCGTATRHWESGVLVPFPCPDRQLHGFGRQPFIQPQPQAIGCHLCTYLQNSGELLVEVDLGTGQTLSSATLELSCPLGQEIYHLTAGGPPLVSGEEFKATGLEQGCTVGSFSFVVNQSGSPPLASGNQPVFVANP
ncbi:MAG: hypothetical protein K0U98_23300 [Deltaproteobacteria bacterium]|nr:hypothetical protein [Deltaproteobacteria bacterium]